MIRNVRAALQTLFTPTERRYPFLIYFAPGAFVASILGTINDTIFQTILGNLQITLFKRPRTDNPWARLDFTQFVICIGVVMLHILITTPLSVLAVRLFIQRNNELVGYSEESEGDTERSTTLPSPPPDEIIQWESSSLLNV